MRAGRGEAPRGAAQGRGRKGAEGPEEPEEGGRRVGAQGDGEVRLRGLGSGIGDPRPQPLTRPSPAAGRRFGLGAG